MTQYNLPADESIVLQDKRMSFKQGSGPQECGELTLTNKSLLFSWETQKLFSRAIPHREVYPLSQIKIIDGRPQMRATDLDGSDPSMELDFVNRPVSLSFLSSGKNEKKKELVKWMDAISLQLTGQPSEEATAIRKTIPGVEMFASVLKGTINTIKDTVGVGGSTSIETKLVTGKCIGCRAPITGRTGQTVQCQYCDIRQTL